MQNITRIALPGYNALTDTNRDHYSVFADEDNILIKELLSDERSIAEYNVLATIPHNLGYIPLAFVWGNLYSSETTWQLITNQFNAVTVPQVIQAVDTKNLYIYNFGGRGSDLPTYSRIFYDDMSELGNPEITEDSNVVKIARPGKSADSLNPNDYIIHSSLNNLKILYQGKKTISLNPDLNSFPHDANIDSPFQCLVFVKFPDGKTTLAGYPPTMSYDESKGVTVRVDGTNIYVVSSGSFTAEFSYFFFGKGKDGLITLGGPTISVAKDGINALTNTNPDNFNFHSHFPTLKYYMSDKYDMGSVSTTTVKLIPHGLGYTPFFAGYVSDLYQFNVFNNNSEPVYALTPYYLGRSTFGSPNKDVGAFIYADSDYLYLKAYFQPNALGTNFPFNKFFYKIFRNNLNL